MVKTPSCSKSIKRITRKNYASLAAGVVNSPSTSKSLVAQFPVKSEMKDMSSDNSISTVEVQTSAFMLSAKGCICHAVWEWHYKASKLITLIGFVVNVIEVANPHTNYRTFWNIT